jgi:multicomponent Na+:H+ antiporter subunit A
VAQLLILHLLAAAVAPVLATFLGSRAFLLLSLVPASAFGWLLAQTAAVDAGTGAVQRVSWVPGLGLELDFRLTTLSWVLALLVTGVGALVLFYCAWYFDRDDPTVWRFGAIFTAFAGAMLGLVVTDNLLVLYIFWELTTVLSYLLIGHNPASSTNRRAAMQALLVTTVGGLAMLGGIIAVGERYTYSIHALVTAPPPPDPILVVGVLLLLVGALSKSALVPFHFWLPGAMAAPTPVSAYLHAAAMVKAGVYLVAVFAPAFAGVPGWHVLTCGLGVVTMLVGGWHALRQDDLKLLLAYGTVSQLGLMVAVAGLGTAEAGLAALALVVAHALFKATLFLVVGVIDKVTGTRDLRRLSGVGRRLLPVSVPAVLAALSMAGIPPLAGFVAKEAALEADAAAALAGSPLPSGWTWLLLAGLVAGSALTVGYTARFVWGAFASKPGVAPTRVRAPHPGFVAAPLVLGLLSLLAGLAAGPLSTHLIPYAAGLTTGARPVPLRLWHGVTLSLVLSLVAIVVGLALFRWRTSVERLQAAVPDRVDAERGYIRLVRWLDVGAVEVTARTQRGSLPLYLGAILFVFVALPGVTALVRGSAGPVRLWDSPAQAVVGLIIIAAAVLTIRTDRRLTSVLLVGVTGYGLSMLFILHGAPDLAITQMLVETVALVVFVLTLRRLPTRFATTQRTARRWARGLVATAFGLAVAAVTFVSAAARRHAPDSVTYPEGAFAIGHGRNVVNVTLVDIRAWDTLGEVSVLVAAATGIASLVFVRTRNTRITRASHTDLPPTDPSRGTWLRGGRMVRKERRSVILEVVTRLVFHVIMAASLYLLFSGHNLPGGGFAGGLVAGLGLLVRYLAGGRHELDEAAPFDAGLVVGLGLLVVAVTALVPMALGAPILSSAVFEWQLPIWGEVTLVTSLFFDIGVYLIVVGMMLDIVRSLGTGLDRQISQDEPESAGGPRPIGPSSEAAAQ